MAPPKKSPPKSRKKKLDDTLSQLPACQTEHLRSIAVKLLNKIEEQIDCPQDTEELSAIADRLFGARTSLVDTLLKLAELLSMLTRHEQDKPETAAPDEKTVLPDTFDMSVMQAFIDRVRKLHEAEEVHP